MAQFAILHLMNGFQDCSISRIVKSLVLGLGQEDYDWHIGGLSGMGSMQQEFRSLGTQVVDFSHRQNGARSATGRIRDYVAAHRIGIVHTHNPRAILAVAMALAGKRETIHLATKHLLFAPRDRRWGLIYTLVDRLSLYLPDHLVSVSKTMCRQIIAYPGLDSRQVTAIRSGKDYDSYHVAEQRAPCRQELGLATECEAIGYAGRMEKAKRLDVLVRAFAQVSARHPQARLLMIGEGELRARLEALAASLGVSHAVIWTGFRRDIPRLLAAMDVYVQPSANEGLPLSILEAMAAGKAIAATRIGGVVELIEDEVTGLLVPPGDPSALSAAILRLLADKALAERIGRVARSRVAHRFSLQSMVKAYDVLYRRYVE